MVEIESSVRERETYLQYHSFWHLEQRLVAASPHTAHLGGSDNNASNTSMLYTSAHLQDKYMYV